MGGAGCDTREPVRRRSSAFHTRRRVWSSGRAVCRTRAVVNLRAGGRGRGSEWGTLAKTLFEARFRTRPQAEPHLQRCPRTTRPATLPTSWLIACSMNRLRPMPWTSGPRQRCLTGKHQQRGAYLRLTQLSPPFALDGRGSEARRSQ